MSISLSNSGPVYLQSGRWVRPTVRRYPQGVCPRCLHTGSLKRNPSAPSAHDPDGWITRQHRDSRNGDWCLAHDAIAQPITLPAGWD